MRSTASAVVLVLLFVGVGFAQSNRGTITGTVTDPTGAMVPNATVEAKSLDTGVTYKAATSETGNYTIGQLPTGTYQVTATAAGFKQFTQTGIAVSTAQALRVDVKLTVGNISEVVSVSSQAPILQTENAQIGEIVSSSKMDDLPILNISTFGIRDTYSAVNLTPGGQEMTPPGSRMGSLRVNGVPAGTESVMIDGQDATETAWSAAYNMAMPGQDAMQEVAIQTSNYSAEYGQAGAAIFNMTMKSGTNHPHGSAYEYMRNDDLNASQPYNHVTPVDKRHDYGFTLGGPVYIPHLYDGRDKTFFFFSFEQNRQSLSVTNTVTVPTLAFRNGDFSSELNKSIILGTDPAGNPIYQGEIFNPFSQHTAANGQMYRDPFMGCDGQHMNVICFDPSVPGHLTMDTVAQNLQAAIPLPLNANPTGNYTASYANAPLTTIPSIKIDHNLSSRIKLSGSWSMTDIHQPFPDVYQTPVTTERDLWETTHTARINVDYTISPTMLLHLGGGYMGFSFFDPVPNYQQYDPLAKLGLPGTYSNIPPSISGISNPDGSGMAANAIMGTAMGPNAQQHQWSQKPTGTVALSWVKGNHTYKFGGDLRVESYPSLVTTPSNGAFNFSAAETAEPYLLSTSIPTSSGFTGNIGNNYASFLLGLVDNGSIGRVNDFHLGKHSFAFYAQDTWKVTPKLTLDYGLRYDYMTYLQNNGFVPAFGFNTPNPSYDNLPGAAIFEGSGPGKCNCDFASNYPYDFGPRLGVAYQITPKTVFRGGIGVSYGQTEDLEMDTLRMGSSYNYGPSTTYGEAITQLQDGPALNSSQVLWPNFDPGQIPASPGATNPNAFDRHAGYSPRMLMWSVGIQREITNDMSLEVAYVGNRGAWWNSDGVLTDINRVTPAILAAHNFDPTLANTSDDAVLLQYFNTLSPAQISQYNLSLPYPGFVGTVSQSLRPYPQFGGVALNWSPLGKTWYDALQVKFTKRYSHGLSMTANYTFQKEMVLGTESQNPAFQVSSPVTYMDNLEANKSLSGLSIPHRFVMAANYITPMVNMSRSLSLLMRNWNFGAYLVYQSGFPIMAPIAQNSLNPYYTLSLSQGQVHNWFGSFPGVGFESRVAGQPLFLTNPNSSYDPMTATVLNSAAWANPPKGQYGVGSAYYNDYRYRRSPNENLSLARIFSLKEGISLQFRIELQNVFNRTRIPNPQAAVVIPGIFGNSNFANLALNTGGERTGQIVMRLNF